MFAPLALTLDASSNIVVTNNGTSGSHAPSSSASSTPSSKSSNAGAIAGGVIGGLAVATLIGVGVWFFLLRRSQKTSHRLNMDEVRPEPYGRHPTLPGFVAVAPGTPADHQTHPTIVTHQTPNNRHETLTSPSQYSQQTESTTPGVPYNPYGANATLSDKELARLRELNANAPPGTSYAPVPRGAAVAGRATHHHQTPESNSMTTDSRTDTGSGSGSGTASGSGSGSGRRTRTQSNSHSTDSSLARETVPGNLIGEVEALRREMNQLRADRQTSYEAPPSYAG